MNRYITDTSFRERPVTVAPLPFEAMYKSLQDKQARYDQAEAYEIENKAKIRALSSPITEHQVYLDDYKQRYLKEAETLHKSIPDKGSSEYRRKLQELVETYANDKKRLAIVKVGEEYSKYITDKAKKMAENKYSPAGDFYTSYKGFDDNGNVTPFTYAGMRDKVDWRKEMDERAKSVQPIKYSRDIEDPNTGKRVKVAGERRDLNSILQSFSTLSKEAIEDMDYEFGIKDNKKREQVYKAFAAPYIKNDTEYQETYGEAANPSPYGGGWVEGLQPMYNKELVELSNELIDDNGNIIPTDATWSEGYNEKAKTFGKNTPGFKEGFVAEGFFPSIYRGAKSAISGVFEPKSEEYTINRMKEAGIPIEDMQATSKKLGVPLQQILKQYKMLNTTPRTLQFQQVVNPKARKAVETTLQGNMSAVEMIDAKTGTSIPLKDKEKFAAGDIRVAGKLQPKNDYSPNTWQATVYYKDDEDKMVTKQVFIPHKIKPSNEQEIFDEYQHQQHVSLMSGKYIRQSDVAFKINNKTGEVYPMPYNEKGYTITINPLNGEEKIEANK